MDKTLPLLACLALLTGCGQRNEPASPPPAGDVNAGATLNESTTERPTGQADAEDPATGTNSGRPDAPEDLKPGTDGNTRPPGT